MDEETYQQAKQRIESTLGPVEFDFDRTPLNESARQLAEFKGRQLAKSRALKKIEVVPEIVTKPEEIREKLSNLTGFVPLEEDLKGFDQISKEILRVYLVNQHLEPKKLANSFGKSYQFVAGLLNSKAVQLLRAKYFHKQLDNNTKIGLLKLTEEADPKITLAAAEYLKILHEKEAEDNSLNKINDPKAEKALQMLGDWLSGSDEEITIKRIELG